MFFATGQLTSLPLPGAGLHSPVGLAAATWDLRWLRFLVVNGVDVQIFHEQARRLSGALPAFDFGALR